MSQKSKTPRIDNWCELAMHADVSAVLDLAKSFEIELHLVELQRDKAVNLMHAYEVVAEAAAEYFSTPRCEQDSYKLDEALTQLAKLKEANK